ncbi:PAS domain S-box protein [Sphingomonas sp. DT-204]|uniref:sensor histidine kinase n=1 Tax=Sphingomonas sp. DT-204 TaxID=3396166 RepID=UPI003F1BCD85
MSRNGGEALHGPGGRTAETAARLIGEAGLEHGDERFRQILQALPAALYVTDADGRITFYNEAAAELWGRRPRLGEDWWCGSWRLYWSDGTPMAHDECPMAETLKTGKPIRGKEAIAERPDGSRFPFIPYPTPLFDDAGELVGAVNILVDISERRNAEEAALHLAAIVTSSDDAIVSKDLNGIVASWNQGAERLFGYTAEEMIGQPILKIIPPERHHEEQHILERIRSGERIDHFETRRRRKDGSLVDVSLTVSPIKRGDGRIIGASKIARDISERKRAEAMLARQARRLEALNRATAIVSRNLDLDRVVQSVTDIATELSGARFGAFFYNVANDEGESYLLYALSGVSREAFERFAMPRNTPVFDPTFRGHGIIRSDDIRKDPRYGRNPPHHGMPEGHLPVVSYLAVPVVSSSGEVHGGLFFGHDQPGMFDEDTEALVAAIAVQAAVAMDNARLHEAAKVEIEQRKRAEAAMELLLNEIRHRVKNTLAMVQAIATQTFRSTPAAERDAFIARLRALSEAHDLLTQKNWDTISVGEAVERALQPFLDRNRTRIVFSGPGVRLPAAKALLIAMALHELGTNAVKYGALSDENGRIDLGWDLVEGDGDTCLRLRWREFDGPPVAPPTRAGFGSRMLERALRSERGNARIEFPPEGVSCTIEMSI